MRNLSLAFLAFTMVAAHAGFEAPRGTYNGTQMEEVYAKAESENLPIVYVLTDSKST